MLKKAFRNFIIKRTIGAKLRNRGMNLFTNHDILNKIRSDAEIKRQQDNRPHEVLYFHKVDDPYSHLTIQYIDKFSSAFDIALKPILVGEENPEAVHEPSLYSVHCLNDVKRIAPYYGVKFSATSQPDQELIDQSNSILTAADNKSFAEIAIKVSFALWDGDRDLLNKLSEEYSSSIEEVSKKLIEGNTIRDDKNTILDQHFIMRKNSIGESIVSII